MVAYYYKFSLVYIIWSAGKKRREREWEVRRDGLHKTYQLQIKSLWVMNTSFSVTDMEFQEWLLMIVTQEGNSFPFFLVLKSKILIQQVSYWRTPPQHYLMMASSPGSQRELQPLPEMSGPRFLSNSAPNAITRPTTAARIPLWAIWVFQNR